MLERISESEIPSHRRGRCVVDLAFTDGRSVLSKMYDDVGGWQQNGVAIDNTDRVVIEGIDHSSGALLLSNIDQIRQGLSTASLREAIMDLLRQPQGVIS